MLNWITQSLKKTEALYRTKGSTVGNLIAYNTVGRPVWTPRRYDKLVEEGFKKNIIVYRAVNLIARGAASVPWRLYRGTREIFHHPLLTLLHSPNPRQGGSSFVEAALSYLLLAGNSYIEAVMQEDGTPVELYTLRPDRMKVIPGPQGIPMSFEYSSGGQKKILPVDPVSGISRVLHLKLFNPLNDWYGMSPIEAALSSIDQHNEVSSHNLALLQNGGTPSGAIIVGKNEPNFSLTPEQRTELRESINDLYIGSKNAGRIVVMEGDFEWKGMGLSPKDLNFTEGKNLSAREISQAFGVPPILVGVQGDATFANYKEARLHLWEDTIIPLLEIITDELNRWLSPFYDLQLKIGYDLDEIPALSHRRQEAWKKLENVNFLTLNEKREAVGYAPLSEEEIYTLSKGKNHGHDKILPE